MGRYKGFVWVHLGRLCVTLSAMTWDPWTSLREAGLHVVALGPLTFEWSY